ncbi:hypothetical protein AAFG38_13665, partial [Lacticaseibacillus rhamnosus]|uniref:hypothetical protein n=1 Tax=Lacticaseibacillus rhamnosus TaxID=47715 RepID=UPI00338E71C3
LGYLVVMAFLVNVIKDIGYFCARKPRAFFRISFSSDSKASRFDFVWRFIGLSFGLALDPLMNC